MNVLARPLSAAGDYQGSTHYLVTQYLSLWMEDVGYSWNRLASLRLIDCLYFFLCPQPLLYESATLWSGSVFDPGWRGAPKEILRVSKFIILFSHRFQDPNRIINWESQNCEKSKFHRRPGRPYIETRRLGPTEVWKSWDGVQFVESGIVAIQTVKTLKNGCLQRVPRGSSFEWIYYFYCETWELFKVFYFSLRITFIKFHLVITYLCRQLPLIECQMSEPRVLCIMFSQENKFSVMNIQIYRLNVYFQRTVRRQHNIQGHH